jgi:hypothetical protein
MDRPRALPTESSLLPGIVRRALSLWLALLALTTQAFAPVAHARVLQHLSDGPVSGYVVICSADGLKLINLDDLTAADARDGKPVGFHLPFDVQGKLGKFACCPAMSIPAVAPELPNLLPPVRFEEATAPPRTPGLQRADSLPPDRPGHPRDPPALHRPASS